MRTANDFFIAAEISRWVSSWSGPGPELRVLDLGCGRSPYLRILSSTGAMVVSVDLESRGGATQVLADASRLPFSDGSFDKVLFSEVLEHTPHQSPVIEELARVTKVGGSIFLSTPLHYSLHELPFDYFRPTEYGLRWMFESAGCTVSRLQRRGGAICVVTTMCVQLVYGLLQMPGRIPGLGRLYSRAIIPILGKVFEMISYSSFALSYGTSGPALPLHQLRGMRRALSLWTNGYCVEAVRERKS